MPSYWQVSPHARRMLDALKKEADRAAVWEAAFTAGSEYGYERHRAEWFGRHRPVKPPNPFTIATTDTPADDVIRPAPSDHMEPRHLAPADLSAELEESLNVRDATTSLGGLTPAERLTPERVDEIIDENMRGKSDLRRYLRGGKTTGELDTPAERPRIPDPDTAFRIAKARSDELKGLKTFHPLPDLGEYIDKAERGATGTDEEPSHEG